MSSTAATEHPRLDGYWLIFLLAAIVGELVAIRLDAAQLALPIFLAGLCVVVGAAMFPKRKSAGVSMALALVWLMFFTFNSVAPSPRETTIGAMSAEEMSWNATEKNMEEEASNWDED